MSPLLSDAQFNSIALILIAAIGIIPATLAAVWSRGAKQNSLEAKDNAAGALHEVKANGGMTDPDPTLKDYVKYVGDYIMKHERELGQLKDLLDEHLKHSRLMDTALAEVYLSFKQEQEHKDLN